MGGPLVSGRWFSILREDDSDYLSSRWLAQDCLGINDPEQGESQGGGDKRKPELNKYLDYQIESLQKELDELRRKRSNEPQGLCQLIPTYAFNLTPSSSQVKQAQYETVGIRQAHWAVISKRTNRVARVRQAHQARQARSARRTC